MEVGGLAETVQVVGFLADHRRRVDHDRAVLSNEMINKVRSAAASVTPVHGAGRQHRRQVGSANPSVGGSGLENFVRDRTAVNVTNQGTALWVLTPPSSARSAPHRSTS